MKFHAKIRYFGVLYLSVALFWYAIGEETIRSQFVQLDPFVCNYTAVCATSSPSRAFSVRWLSQCSFECRHHPESCVGFNYRKMDNRCEIFAANPISFLQTVAGCQYTQVHGYSIVKLSIRYIGLL